MAGEHVDLADEHRGDQEQRDQPRGGQVAVQDEGDADQTGAGEHAVQQRAAAAGDADLDCEHRARRRRWISAASSALRRSTWAWPSEVRMSSRAATPSSVEAAWSVQAASSRTLRSAICGQQPADGEPDEHAAQREQERGGPPGHARRRSTAVRPTGWCAWPSTRPSASAGRPPRCRRRSGRGPRRRPARTARTAAGPSRRRSGRRAAGPRPGRPRRPRWCGRRCRRRRRRPRTARAASRASRSASRPAGRRRRCRGTRRSRPRAPAPGTRWSAGGVRAASRRRPGPVGGSGVRRWGWPRQVCAVRLGRQSR